MKDFEQWYQMVGIQHLRGYSDSEMVALRGLLELAWNAATDRAIAIADHYEDAGTIWQKLQTNMEEHAIKDKQT